MAHIPSEHKRPWITKAARPKNPHALRLVKTTFYKSAAWKKCRAAYIAAFPNCAQCERKGRIEAATMVDHIRQINRNDPWDDIGGRFPHPLDWDNLQSLCDHHHARKSGFERHKKETI